MMTDRKELWYEIALRLFNLLPLQKKKIVFESYRGLYNDSPKAIFLAMKEQHPEYRYIWMLKNENREISGAEVVNRKSLKALYHLATAKVWVDNARKQFWVRKRRGQIYVQTWHGGLALKKIEKDAGEKLPESYQKIAIHDSEMADYFLSGAKWTTEMFRRAFWYNGEILEYGTPRSDIFFQDAKSYREKVREFYALPDATRLVLYAPTFRDSRDAAAYDLDIERLLVTLERKHGGTWAVLIRLHPNVSKLQKSFEYTDRVKNGTLYDGVEDLIIAADYVITDYSSVMFDAMESGTRCVLYASDIQDYEGERGFYFKFSELPFDLAKSNEELQEVIEKFDEERYAENVKKFKEWVGLCDNAKASARVAETLFQRIERKRA